MITPKDKIIKFIKNSIETHSLYWQEVEYQKGNILFSQGETIEKLYFVKEGILRSFGIDKRSGIEYTLEFIFADEAHIPMSAFNCWCPSMSGIQAIGNTNVIMEIDIEDWLNNLDGKDPLEMEKYAKSIEVGAMNDFVKHFVFDKSENKSSLKEYYHELKKQNHSLVNSDIDVQYLASYFLVNKRSMEKVIKEYKKENLPKNNFSAKFKENAICTQKQKICF